MTQNPNDTFRLARYAYNKLAPLFEQAKAIEPSLQFTLELTFADEQSQYHSENALTVAAHWGRGGVFHLSNHLLSTEDVDEVAAKIEADLGDLMETRK